MSQTNLIDPGVPAPSHAASGAGAVPAPTGLGDTIGSQDAPARRRRGRGARGEGALDAEQPRGVRSFVELSKPRITRLVTITSSVGFVLGAVQHAWQAVPLIVAALGAIAGTWLASAGANTLNQWLERDRDARMKRTHRRPLPSERITPPHALAFGLATSFIGVAILWLTTGLVPAMVALATIIAYVLVYTPLKPVTALSTIVGAVPGALPPLIGYTAGFGAGDASPVATITDPVGWSLFAILFVWQIPHFLAIAWMYREDYERGGFRILPLEDPTGRRTSAAILLWTVCLIPVTLLPVLLLREHLGLITTLAALLVGFPFLAAAIAVVRTPQLAAARRVFFLSIIHLPILLIAMVADALVSIFPW